MKHNEKVFIIMFLLLIISILALWKVNIELDRYVEAVEFKEIYISDIEVEKLQLDVENSRLKADNVQLQVDKERLELQGLQAELGQVKHMKVEATAYCPCSICCGKYADGITATGTKATEGRTAAVDPNVIPLGSTIWIPSLGLTLTAEDTGSAIKGNIIDIFFGSHKEASNFDRQKLEIYVLESKK